VINGKECKRMRINGREKQFRDISGDISSPPPKCSGKNKSPKIIII